MTSKRSGICGVLCVVSVLGLVGCQREGYRPLPPDVRRPQIKSQAELAAEREERIRAGKVVPTSSPVVLSADRAARSTRRRPPPIQPTPGAIEADILIINDSVLTVAEVLYPLRHRLEELRRTRTRAGFREEARRLIRRTTQEEIGSLLIYAEAVSQLEDEQRDRFGEAVDKALENETRWEFGGSEARLSAHLREYGLIKEQLRDRLGRSMVVREYTREKLMPQVRIRRDELLGYYRRNISRYSTPETRELLLIELSFEKFLPEGRTWERASRAERAQAKLKAMRRAREAHAALAEKPFEEVAREYSLGLHADSGGSWGTIGRPLQPPYDMVTKLVFEYAQGQTSEPVETETGWCIVKCGRVEPASRRAFADVQDEIRQELMERRFNKLSVDYVLRLAENATISSLDPFVAAAVQRAEKQTAAATSGQ